MRSRPLAPLAWWESDWVQLGAFAVPMVAFVPYPVSAFVIAAARLARRGQASRPAAFPLPGRWWASGLVLTGLAAMVGFAVYFALVLAMGGAFGPVIGGRPLPWLALQLLAVAACACAALLAVTWWTNRAALPPRDRVRQGVLLAGGATFMLWAVYWSLLRP